MGVIAKLAWLLHHNLNEHRIIKIDIHLQQRVNKVISTGPDYEQKSAAGMVYTPRHGEYLVSVPIVDSLIYSVLPAESE